MALTEYLAVEEEKVRLIPEKLASWIEIDLTETSTIWLFKSEGTLVSQYSEEAEGIIKRNNEYIKSCEQMQTIPAMSADTSVETYQPSSINVALQSEVILMKESGSWATIWDNYDSMNEPGEAHSSRDTEKDERLFNSLNLMECLLSLNLYQNVLTAYRKSNNEKTGDKEQETCRLQYLWSFSPAVVGHHSVTCMSWNPVNQDLLSVGYGSFKCNNSQPSFVCCWSLKNLLHPRRYIPCPASVTSLDFSKEKPNRLACGLFDGTVMVYDILPAKGQLLWDSRAHNLHHVAPIWRLRWAQMPVSHRLKKSDQILHEVLITSSEDGKIAQWEFTKEKITRKDLLNLKMEQRFLSSSIIEGLTRFQPIWDFDFDGSDMNGYLVSTGCGNVYECCILEPDKGLEAYKEHYGSVYKVRICPSHSDVFLTCGADWTMKLWWKRSSECLMSFQTAMCPLYDLDWSPFSSTQLACVSSFKLDVWDLNESILDPVMTRKADRKEILTAVAFSKTSASLFVGNEQGKVTAYLLTNTSTEMSDNLLKIVEQLKTH